MTPLAITALTVVSAVGHGLQAHLEALEAGRTGLAPRDFETAALGAWIGQVDGLDTLALPPGLDSFDCRNNRLAEAALRADGFDAAVQAAVRRWGAGRVGVFLGTSTSAILQTELAYRRRDPATGALPADLCYATTQNIYSVAHYLRERLGLRGPAHVVSTACSSSAKVYATAERMISLGWIDAAVVGGADSLCMTTLYGFHALELCSTEVCRPWDADRKGLSLGEAAAFALVEREPARALAWLLGAGESSDGHHMSSPHPEGAGAAAAMRGALAQAGLRPADVDYLNLHGTGTPGNDAAEDRAVQEVFGTDLPCSSTKGTTGHTLGAAGAVEAALVVLGLQHGLMPAGLHVRTPDPALHSRYLREALRQPVRVAASNSFGFGGSNACLVFGRGTDGPQSASGTADAAPRDPAGIAEAPGPTAASAQRVAQPLRARVLGVGIVGPGMADWTAAGAALREPPTAPLSRTVVPAPERLPPTERRRAGAVVKLAIAVADQAVAAAGADPQALATVFTSSTGDPLNCHQLCEALAAPQRMVSPTKFTNSVHNAAAGYWHIATRSMQASTSIGAYDASFAAGLLEAMAQVAASGRPVLMVACDVPYPEPLNAVRPLLDAFGVAMLLGPSAPGEDDGGVWLEVEPTADAPATPCDAASLEAVRAGIPAARALPLLQALARGGPSTIVVDGSPGAALKVTLR